MRLWHLIIALMATQVSAAVTTQFKVMRDDDGISYAPRGTTALDWMVFDHSDGWIRTSTGILVSEEDGTGFGYDVDGDSLPDARLYWDRSLQNWVFRGHEDIATSNPSNFALRILNSRVGSAGMLVFDKGGSDITQILSTPDDPNLTGLIGYQGALCMRMRTNELYVQQDAPFGSTWIPVLTGASTDAFAFGTIDTEFGSDPVADSTGDTLIVTSGVGAEVTGDSSTDTVTISSQEGHDAFLLAVRNNMLVTGGIVTWSGSGLTFDITAAEYYIQGVRHTSPASSVTLDDADPDDDRFDMIALDDTGHAVVVTGTPGENPQIPSVDTTSQLGLTAVLVPAGATEPEVSTTLIYAENLGSPTEWTAGSSSASYVWGSTTDPYTGSKHLNVNASTNGQFGSITTTAFNLAAYNSIRLFVKPVSGFTANKRFTLRWYNNGAALGSAVTVNNGLYGFNTESSTYQMIVIPLSDFVLGVNTTVDALRFQTVNSSGTLSYRVDNVQIQSGLEPPITNVNSFVTMDTPSGTDPVADSAMDVLTWAGGTGIDIVGNAASDLITIAVNAAYNLIPDGTVTNSMLRWTGSNWAQVSTVQATAGGALSASALNSTPIGQSVPAAGTFNALRASSEVVTGNLDVSGTSRLGHSTASPVYLYRLGAGDGAIAIEPATVAEDFGTFTRPWDHVMTQTIYCTEIGSELSASSWGGGGAISVSASFEWAAPSGQALFRPMVQDVNDIGGNGRELRTVWTNKIADGDGSLAIDTLTLSLGANTTDDDVSLIMGNDGAALTWSDNTADNRFEFNKNVWVDGSLNATAIGISSGLAVDGNVALGDAGTDTITLKGQVSANSSVGTAGQVLTSRGANLSPQWSSSSSPENLTLTGTDARLTFGNISGSSDGGNDAATIITMWNGSGSTLTAGFVVESAGTSSASAARNVALYNQFSYGQYPGGDVGIIGVVYATASTGNSVRVVVSGIADVACNGTISVGQLLYVNEDGRAIAFSPSPLYWDPSNGAFIVTQSVEHCLGIALQSNASGNGTIRAMIRPSSYMHGTEMTAP